MTQCAECTQPISSKAVMCPHCGAPPEVALAKRIQKGNEPLPEVLDEAIRAASMWPEGDLTDHQLSNIEQIKLDDRKVEDWPAMVAGFRQLPKLKMLGLSRTGLTDVGLLGEFSQLRYLYLEKNGITHLSGICGLKNLKQIWLYGNSIHHEQLIKLEQALPKCEIFI
ncbi:MAG: hypothetical protein CMO79_02975 [Verrucomicrobiales bacterium]|nr:hypothetical protein [Verrucomicrobiales bacterium]